MSVEALRVIVKAVKVLLKTEFVRRAVFCLKGRENVPRGLEIVVETAKMLVRVCRGAISKKLLPNLCKTMGTLLNILEKSRGDPDQNSYRIPLTSGPDPDP